MAKGRTEEGHFSFFRQSFFFSLLIHLTLFLALLWGFSQTDKRPIHSVNYWVVNLITEWNAEPKGVRSGNIEGATLALPKKQEKPKPDPAPTIPHEIPLSLVATVDTETFVIPEENTLALRRAEEDPSPTIQPILPPSGIEMENALKVMKDTMNREIQLGQVLFSMRMQDQVAGLKIKYFQRNTRIYLENTLQGAIAEEERIALQGKSASAKISFSENGIPPEIAILKESDPTLAAILNERIDWRTVSSPSSYALPHKSLNVRVAVSDTGNITVRVELL